MHQKQYQLYQEIKAIKSELVNGRIKQILELEANI